jgi:hypothetical protein
LSSTIRGATRVLGAWHAEETNRRPCRWKLPGFPEAASPAWSAASADPTGHGQGQFYLGYTTVTTDQSGNASFAVALPFTGAPGKVISATATAVTGSNTTASLTFGDTSEFSADLTAF